MKTYTALESINQNQEYFSLAIGNFDGVHKGHQELLAETVQDAISNKGFSGVFTFWPHPLKTLKEDFQLKLLTNFERKKHLLAKTGLDLTLFVPFTIDIMQLSPEEFVKNILCDTLHVSSVHVGFNFTFGRKAEGDVNDLISLGKKYGFKVNMLPEYKLEGHTVSSTFIRQLIEDGEVDIANKLLGYTYKVSGEVVTGEQRGRTIGFPTANINIGKEMIVPAKGVYGVRASVEGTTYNAVLNIGTKPTFNSDNVITIEAHLLGFNGDIYGKTITIEFIKRIRGEKKFYSVENLIQEIRNDIMLAQQIF